MLIITSTVGFCVKVIVQRVGVWGLVGSDINADRAGDDNDGTFREA